MYHTINRNYFEKIADTLDLCVTTNKKKYNVVVKGRKVEVNEKKNCIKVLSVEGDLIYFDATNPSTINTAFQYAIGIYNF